MFNPKEVYRRLAGAKLLALPFLALIVISACSSEHQPASTENTSPSTAKMESKNQNTETVSREKLKNHNGNTAAQSPSCHARQA